MDMKSVKHLLFLLALIKDMSLYNQTLLQIIFGSLTATANTTHTLLIWVWLSLAQTEIIVKYKKKKKKRTILLSMAS